MVLLTFCATPIASSTWRPSKAYLPAANTGIADGVRPVLGGRWVAVAVLLFVLTALVRRMGQYLLAAAGAGLPRHLLRDARARRGRHWAGAAALLPRGLPRRIRLVAGCAVPWPRRASAAATTRRRRQAALAALTARRRNTRTWSPGPPPLLLRGRSHRSFADAFPFPCAVYLRRELGA